MYALHNNRKFKRQQIMYSSSDKVSENIIQQRHDGVILAPTTNL